MKKLAIIFLSLLLLACGRSKEPQLYVLNPLPPQKHKQIHQGLRIVIDQVILPDYVDKPQLLIFTSAHQGQLLENHQWAERLQNNAKKVIQTNLISIMPKTMVLLAPVDSLFQPNRRLSVDISEFKMDIQGNNKLRAVYQITTDGTHVRQYEVSYCTHTQPANPSTAVLAMNGLLIRLSRDIARHM